MYYIYQIYCEGNGKTYVGQTNNISRRWSRHRRDLEKNKHLNHYLQNAYNKYGAESFKFEMVNTLETRDEANEQELFWINAYRRIDLSMNIGGHLKVTDKSPETIEKHRKAITGKKRGKYSKEHGNNISRAKKAQHIKSPWLTERNKDRRERFAPVTFEHAVYGQEKVDDSTIKEFCDKYNLNMCHIQSVRKNKRNSHNGWRLV